MSMHVDHGQQEQELITLFHSASIHNLSESAAVYGYLLHTLFHQSFYYASHLMQQGRHHAVYALLADQVALNGGSGSNHGQYKASLLFAAACIKLDKHVEAEMALQALLQPGRLEE